MDKCPRVGSFKGKWRDKSLDPDRIIQYQLGNSLVIRMKIIPRRIGFRQAKLLLVIKRRFE